MFLKPFTKLQSITIWRGSCAVAPLISSMENMKVAISLLNISLSGLGTKLWMSKLNLMNCVSNSSYFFPLTRFSISLDLIKVAGGIKRNMAVNKNDQFLQ
jgi:hypothetical protein